MAGELVKLKRGTKATMPTAKEAGSILIATDTGEAYVDNSSTERIQLKDSTKLPLSGGTMTGPINMGANKVTSSSTPSSGSDLTNKTYVDKQIINVGTSTLKAVKADTDTSDAITTSVSPTSTDVTITVNHTENLGTGTAGTKYGPSSATSVAFGGSFNVPNIVADDYGHVTSVGHVAITLPKAPTVTISAGNAGVTASGTTVSHVTHTAQSGGPTANASPAHGGTFVVPQVTSDGYGHVTAVTNRTITLPAAPGSVGTLSTPRAIDGVNFNGSADINHYGSCSTAAATAAKTVALTGFKLVTGAHVYVKFTVTNTAANPTLNVNSTGAKAIYYRGSAISSGYLAANKTYEFIYNGTQYEFVGDINTNTTYSPGTGLDLSGTTFSLENSGVSAGSYGPSANVSGTNGTTINIPQITVDAKGRVTSITNRVLTNRDTNTTYGTMQGATSSAAGETGLVPAPAAGAATRYLRSDGTWQVPPNTTYSNMKGATASAAGSAGLVPAPAAGKQTSFLRGDGTWVVPTNTTYGIATTSANGLLRQLDGSTAHFMRGDGTWATPPNTTYSAFKGATTSAAGGSGLVPAPAKGAATRYLRSDGTWAVPPDTNTTYSNMTGASSSAAGEAGLVPAPSAGAATRYLRSDGTWAVPPDTNTTYKAGTGLTLSGTTFSHANYNTTETIGPSANTSPAFGGTFTVPQVTTNAQGHVTAMNSRTITIPQPKLTTSVSDSSVQFRNIVVLPKGTDPNSVSCPVGTIICVKE